MFKTMGNKSGRLDLHYRLLVSKKSTNEKEEKNKKNSGFVDFLLFRYPDHPGVSTCMF